MKKKGLRNFIILFFSYLLLIPKKTLAQEEGIISKAMDSLPIDDFILTVTKIMVGALNAVISTLTALAGAFFDLVLQFMVRDANQIFTNYFEPAILPTWAIFRDIGNIIIIFSLLYLAIKTIIEGNGFADKKMLSGILLAALLVNFSLFFTKTFFSVSNEVSSTIFKGIGGSEKVDGQGENFVYQISQDFGIAPSLDDNQNQDNNNPGFMNLFTSSLGSTLIDRTGVVGKTAIRIYNSFDVAASEENTNKFEQIVVLLRTFVMSTILQLIIATIFVIGGFALVIRYLIFILLMITSAIGLVGFLIPFLRSKLSIWWKHLIKQTIFLPVFMLFFYIAFSFIRTVRNPQIQSTYASTVSGNNTFTDFMSMGILEFVMFAMSVGFLILAIFIPFVVAESASGLSPKMTNKLKGYGNSTINWAKRRSLQGIGSATGKSSAKAVGGVRTWNANRTLNNQGLKDAAIAGNQKAMSKLKRASDVKNKSTSDFRNIKIGNSTLGEKTGLGKGIKNYETRVKEEKKKLEDQKKQEMKILGLEGKKSDPQIREMAKQEHEANKKKVESARKDYRAAIELGDSSTIEKAKNDLKEATDEHTKTQNWVSKAENLGEWEYHEKVMKSRTKKASEVFKKATDKVIEDAEKKWKKGKSEQYLDNLKKELEGEKDNK